MGKSINVCKYSKPVVNTVNRWVIYWKVMGENG